MDIVLINTRSLSFEDSQFDSFLHGERKDTYPLGILYIAAVLKKQGCNVRVIDFNIIREPHVIDDTLQQIAEDAPGIIGISISTQTYDFALKIIRFLKSALGNRCLLVSGGCHPSFSADEMLENGLSDLVVRGEGEEVMPEIVKQYLKKPHNKDWSGIPSVSYLSDGRAVHNDPALAIVKNLDELPFPDRDLLELNQYRNPGTIISSRGCVAHCQFCVSGLYKPRVRSAENVADEVEYVSSRYGIKHIDFVDDTFTINKPRVLRIFELLRKKGIELNYSIKARVSQIDGTFVGQLKEGGVIGIQFGVETGNEQVLKDIEKGITLKEVNAAVNLCLKYEMDVYCSFIIGHPTDTLETINDTIAFARQLRRKGVNCFFGPLTPYPGTDVFINRDKLGIKIVDWSYSHWDLKETVIRTRNLSRKQIISALRSAYAEINSL